MINGFMMKTICMIKVTFNIYLTKSNKQNPHIEIH